MRHHIFKEANDNNYPVAILIKGRSFNKQELHGNYVVPLVQHGIPEENIIAFTLEYNDQNKAPVKLIKEYLDTLLKALNSIGTKYLYVADSAYFKVLVGQTKAEPHHGYVLPCKIKGYEHINVVLGINHQLLIFDPQQRPKLQMGLDTLASHINSKYKVLGENIIHSAYYPETAQEVREALQKLHGYPSLTADIEAFSLRFNEAGIATIAFAWDQHNGIAFACDYLSIWDKKGNPAKQAIDRGIDIGAYEGVFIPNQEIRELIKEFLSTYKGNITWHNATFDVKVLIATLWMKNLTDTDGLLTGLQALTSNWNDTKIIAYLATNSTAGNTLGLKPLAHEFAGNYAVEEIKDVRKIALPKLLQYNLVDALSTFYVKNKYEPIMVRDQQLELYNNLMMPSQRLIIQIELTGMPLNKKKVQETKATLEAIQLNHKQVIVNSPIIKVLDYIVQTKAMEAANAKLKTKQHPLSHFADQVFNPDSPKQLQILFYEQMGLPVIDKTDTGQPSTGADTIEKLINHVTDPGYKAILEALIGYGKVTKILSTFIPAFEEAIEKGTGDIVWLHGSFNLGGTVSGRLSSSDPNLQNIPAGSTYAKLIKNCFMAPEGWLFSGADFNSLEDYISALTTKDPNKLAVYERGFDGHCLRAAYYFRDQLIHIDVDDPKSVNSIKKTHPELRQESKTPTFALTYQGTHYTLMANLGWDKEKAQSIENAYHELYKVSDEYVQNRLEQASKDGYVSVAFGLRVRTPLLEQVIFGSSKMPKEAKAEGRTAGNALGQSYGLLNNRAAIEFMEKVWASPYRLDIKPVALIHDAIYLLIKDDVDVIEFANRELIKSMQWQELPEIQHPTVKLGAALDIFYPSWADPITLPNNGSIEVIQDTVAKAMEERKKEKDKK